MNDLGVSLHSYYYRGGFTAFLGAVKEVLESEGGIELDPRYLDRGFKPGQNDSPVFGIARQTPRWVRALPQVGPTWEGGSEAFGWAARERLIDHFREHFLKSGDAEHPTLVLHSSGYDSRILSSCLMQLRRGGHDLGKIHFRCHDPEGPTFLEIMQRQGWEPDEYSVFAWPETDLFDVGRWEAPGVAGWLPVTSYGNFWRDIVPAQDEHLYNLMSGTGGGEACEYPTLRKPPFISWDFHENAQVNRWLGFFPDGTEVIANCEERFRKVFFPYFGTGHIETVSQIPERFLEYEANGCDKTRASILRTFEDSTLDIPRAGRTYKWEVSSQRWDSMYAGYKYSYFRNTLGGPDPDELFADLRKNFFTNDSWAGRIWRLAAVIERAMTE